jgi:hypothetical protein
MGRPTTTPNWLRRLQTMLAVMSIAIKVAIPLGFMVGTPAGASGLIPIVLCTTSGDVTAFMDSAGAIHHSAAEAERTSGPDGDKDHDAGGCHFAGQLVPLTAPFHDLLTIRFPAYALSGPVRRIDSAPGLGLAAPPPPKTGPPRHV